MQQVMIRYIKMKHEQSISKLLLPGTQMRPDVLKDTLSQPIIMEIIKLQNHILIFHEPSATLQQQHRMHLLQTVLENVLRITVAAPLPHKSLMEQTQVRQHAQTSSIKPDQS